jgi:Carbohydrate-selective porin, OprB family
MLNANNIFFRFSAMLKSPLKLAIISFLGWMACPMLVADAEQPGATKAITRPDQAIATQQGVEIASALNNGASWRSTATPLQKEIVAQAEPTPPATPASNETPAASQFSTTTKLQGQVIFGFGVGLSGNLNNNAILGHRTRLELATELGGGTLTTRLQATGLGLNNNSGANPALPQDTPEGSTSFGEAGSASAVGIDLLKYELPIGPRTQLVIAANAAGADDFTDSINPYLDGDGASGAVSRFGGRPSIYYLVSGAGAGVRHQFSDTLEGSLGFLSGTANDPTTGNGLSGSYGAIAQLTYKPSGNTKFGLTYVNARNVGTDTGSNNASNLTGSNNMFGLQASVLVSPGFALGGWVGYNKNTNVIGDRDIVNWAVTAAFPDLGAPGNLGGLIIGQEPRVTAATGLATADSGSSLHLEGFYQIKVSDSISITPGLIYLTAPDHNSANPGALIGTIRTTFSF